MAWWQPAPNPNDPNAAAPGSDLVSAANWARSKIPSPPAGASGVAQSAIRALSNHTGLGAVAGGLLGGAADQQPPGAGGLPPAYLNPLLLGLALNGQMGRPEQPPGLPADSRRVGGNSPRETEPIENWKAALAHAEQLKVGGAISQRELNDIKTQAKEAGMIPVGSTVFDNWEQALAHANKLKESSSITRPDLDEIKRSAQGTPPIHGSLPPTSDQLIGGISPLDRVRKFLSNFQGPSPAY